MKKIAIIGGGISGLYFANLLQKNQNYQYKVFEKKSHFELHDGYGIQLSVNSIKLLNEIGFKNIEAKEISFPNKVNFYLPIFYIILFLFHNQPYHHVWQPYLPRILPFLIGYF